MSHILEHVPWFDTVATLREVLRILKPGGEVEIWVPDFAKIAKAYLEKRPGDTWFKFNPKKDYMTWINGRTFTYGPGDENWHRAVFDEAFLKRQLREAGFCYTKRLVRPRGYDHGAINLGVAATK
jgi:predicted SAM-dependent methyltransferase